MKKIAFIAPLLPLLLACTPAQVNTVNTVITDAVNSAQFACIEASPLTTAPEVVLACKIVNAIDQATPGMLSFVDSLIAQRQALLASGFAFDKQSATWKK
jgi:hypothetical protein